MCGINSFVRKLLHFVKQHLSVNSNDLTPSRAAIQQRSLREGMAMLKFKYSYVGCKGGRINLLEKRRKGLVDGVAPPATVAPVAACHWHRHLDVLGI